VEPGLDPIAALPELRAWPVAAALLGRRAASPLACADLVGAACAAFGAPRERAAPAVAAVRALLLSIHLVDDMLDDDPRGEFHRLGPGVTANLALALQAAAIRGVSDGGFGDEASRAMTQRLAQAALATAYGQDLDVQPLHDEEDYFRAADAKTPPLFVCALELGALAGGASAGEAARVGALGRAIGRIVQTSDDLKDALDRPARPDWRARARNLAILYAAVAPHADRERFLALHERVVADEAALVEAQAILFRSGAVSYCAWHLVDAYRKGTAELRGLALPHPEPLVEAFRGHVHPVVELLRGVGVDAPERLVDPPRAEA